MNLVSALILEGARTEEVNLVPTKRFFKPVVLLTAPLSLENAQLLACDYLFDDVGNPRTFEGTHKLAGEIEKAELTFTGAVSGEVTIKTEKVAHLGCVRVEKIGMQLHVRAHLVEDEGKLEELLHFLANLNKEPFRLTVKPGQRTLVEVLDDGAAGPGDPNFHFPIADSSGLYPLGAAMKRPFNSKNCEGFIATMQVEDGVYISGWAFNWKKQIAGGEQLKADSIRHTSKAEALKQASGTAYRWMLDQVTPSGVKQVADHEAALAFLLSVWHEAGAPGKPGELAGAAELATEQVQ